MAPVLSGIDGMMTQLDKQEMERLDVAKRQLEGLLAEQEAEEGERGLAD